MGIPSTFENPAFGREPPRLGIMATSLAFSSDAILIILERSILFNPSSVTGNQVLSVALCYIYCIAIQCCALQFILK